MAETTTTPPAPAVRTVTREDIGTALREGLADFKRAPAYGLFFGAAFSLVGIAIALILYNGEASYWIFPVAAGFPLVGPFAAVGIYEVSRRLEAGEPLSWGPVLTAGFRQKNSQLPLFAVFTLFAFLAWLVLARVIFAVSFGPATMTNVLTSFDMLLTPQGIIMLLAGSIVGAALAALLFAVSVVGVPLLLDRDIDVVTAMITSFEATVESRPAMIYWGALVAAAIVVAMLPLFLGMILIFPVLAHASWHIYRKAVEPGA